MHINPQQPSYLLDCLHQGKTPNGGLAFPKVWPALRLDYSPASLQRISRLLQQIHSQQAARYDILQQSPTGRNFLLTLAAYLTDYLHHHTGAPPQWEADGRAWVGSFAFDPLGRIKLLLDGIAAQPDLDFERTFWLVFHHAADADAQKRGNFLLEGYLKGQQPYHGLAFAEQLAAIALDGSEHSLQAIDRLLHTLRQELALTPDNIKGQFQIYPRRNFLQLLAYYVGDTVAKLAGKTPRWLNLPQTAATIGRQDLDEFYDSMSCDIDGDIAPMLRFITLALSEGQPSCYQWLQGLRTVGQAAVEQETAQPERLEQTTAEPDTAAPENTEPDTDPNCLARQLIDGFLRGQQPPDGSPMPPLAYAAELRALRPDYSLRSLEQLDKLLLQLRQQQPHPDSFTADPAKRAFLHFCACYLARTTAALSHNTLKFLSYPEAKAQIPDLPHGWPFLYAARIGERLYFPLSRLFGLLFEAEPTDNFSTFARQICQQHPGHLYRRSAIADPATGIIPDAWRPALLETGFSLSWSLWDKLEQPDLLLPATLIRPNAQGRSDMIRLLVDSPIQHGLQHGHELLEENPTQARFLTLIYEGYANLPEGRFDAIMAEIRVYHGNRPLQMQACVPYLSAEQGGFAIGPIAINGHNCPPKLSDSLIDALYRGLDDFNMPGRGKRWWRRHYRQSL